MRMCIKCHHEIESDDYMCPFCGSSNIIDVSKKNDDRKRKDEDLSFRIEKVPPGGCDSLKKELKSYNTFIILGFFLWVIGAVVFIPDYLLFGNLDEFEDRSNMFVYISGTIFLILFLVGLLLIVVSVKNKNKFKHFINNGIILKNISFTVVGESNDIFLNVKIVYKDEFGNEHNFVGVLPKSMIPSKNVCDVVVDSDNYKIYYVKYNII